ncbi:MAG: CgeB family protein [Candidatus Acidiferrales bacterium]
MRITIFGLSITSSWANGHASTFRSLVHGLTTLGHDVAFLERDLPDHAANRDLPEPRYARIHVYSSLTAAKKKFAREVRDADLVIVGSCVPEGVALGEWVTESARGTTAFYDLDTPITLAKLERRDHDYISRRLIPRYNLYLSLTGGPTLRRIERRYGAPVARALYGSVDTEHYFPETAKQKFDLGYMGSYAADRQPLLDEFLLEPAHRWTCSRMIVAGAKYPAHVGWPPNVKHIEHIPADEHRTFYCTQRFTLNLTRHEMRVAGFSASARLFEAAACGTPVISDEWEGLETFFRVGTEILTTRSAERTLEYLREIPEEDRLAIGARARDRVIKEHTAIHRARQLEKYASEVLGRKQRLVADTAPPSRVAAASGRAAHRAGA